MAIIIDSETGAKVKIEADMLKGYEKEAEAGVGDFSNSRRSNHLEPAWATESDSRAMESRADRDPVRRDLSTLEGSSYELNIDGRRRRSGIFVGVDTSAADLRRVRVLALEDIGPIGTKEVSYPLDLVLVGRGSLSLRVHFSGLTGVFAKGRLIQAAGI